MTATPLPEPAADTAPASHEGADRVAMLAAECLKLAAEILTADNPPTPGTVEHLLHDSAGRLPEFGAPIGPALRRRIEASALAALTFLDVTCNTLADAGAEGAILADSLLTHTDTVPPTKLPELLYAAARMCERAPLL
jgi:hypothetical protein